MLYSSSHCFWAWIIKRIRIVIYGSNNCLLFFIFSKNNPKNKQMSIGKKKFNMDPKKVYTDRKKLWNENEMTLLHAGFPTKFLSHTPHPPFHSAGQFWVFDYRDHLSDFVYIYSLCWDLSELWFFVRVPVYSKLCTVNSLLLST